MKQFCGYRGNATQKSSRIMLQKAFMDLMVMVLHFSLNLVLESFITGDLLPCIWVMITKASNGGWNIVLFSFMYIYE